MKRAELLSIMKQRIEWGWDFDKIYDYLCELDRKNRNKGRRYYDYE